jgi:hypothetical protein
MEQFDFRQSFCGQKPGPALSSDEHRHIMEQKSRVHWVGGRSSNILHRDRVMQKNLLHEQRATILMMFRLWEIWIENPQNNDAISVQQYSPTRAPISDIS